MLNILRRFLALALTVVLTLTLAAGAFALEEGDPDIDNLPPDSPTNPYLPTTEEPTDAAPVIKCMGYNVVSGSVGWGSKADIELLIYDNAVLSYVSSVSKMYTTVGECSFTQSPEDSIASTIKVDHTRKALVVRMVGLAYTGSGNTLTVDVGYSLFGGHHTATFTVKVLEAGKDGGEGGASPSLAPTLLVTAYQALDAEGAPLDPLLAGQAFKMQFTLKNTSRSIAVKNMTVQIDGGEVFTQTAGVDTLYIESLGAGEELTQEVEMTSAASHTPGSFPVKLALQYEYFDNGTKTDGTDAVTLMQKLTQVDRIRANTCSVEPGYSGSELPLTYGFVNAGFTTLYNAEVQVYDANDQLLASKYIGTVEPSKEAKGSGISLIFYEAGELSLRVVLAYEDANMQPFTYETTANASVMEYTEPVWEEPIIDEPVEEQAGGGLGWLIWLAVGVVVAGGGTALVIILVKKGKAKRVHELEGYDEDL